jgi:hypothetical protein
VTWAREPGRGAYARPDALPEWLGPEVTADDRFSGGSLARLDEASAAALLGEVRRRTSGGADGDDEA